MLTLADTGLRVHDACGLRRGDIDWNEGRAVIIGKGDKQAVVRFSTRSMKALKDAAAEAVVELLVRADGEGGGFLGVGRAQAYQVFPGPSERNRFRDDLHDIARVADFGDLILGDVHRQKKQPPSSIQRVWDIQAMGQFPVNVGA